MLSPNDGSKISAFLNEPVESIERIAGGSAESGLVGRPAVADIFSYRDSFVCRLRLSTSGAGLVNNETVKRPINAHALTIPNETPSPKAPYRSQTRQPAPQCHASVPTTLRPSRSPEGAIPRRLAAAGVPPLEARVATIAPARTIRTPRSSDT